MLFQFATWEGNILAWYKDWLRTIPEFIAKPIGLCTVCFGLWFGIPFAYFNDVDKYAIFLGVSEGLLVLYAILLEALFGE